MLIELSGKGNMRGIDKFEYVTLFLKVYLMDGLQGVENLGKTVSLLKTHISCRGKG